MTSRDFCYWLQGYFEIQGEGPYRSLSNDQVDCIKRHLNMVFEHEIDPSAGDKQHQDALNFIHSPSNFGDKKVRC